MRWIMSFAFLVVAQQAVYVFGQPNPDSYYLEALEQYNKGQFAKTIELCTKAVAIDPKFVKGYQLRGDARRSAQDDDGAIQDYTRAIELTPTDANLFVKRGKAFISKRTPAPAVADFSSAIDLTWHTKPVPNVPPMIMRAMAPPQFSGMFALRSSAYTMQLKFQEAARDLDEAVSYGPKVADHYFSRAWSRLYLGNGRGAAEDARIYLNLNGPKGEYAAYAVFAQYLGNAKSGSAGHANNLIVAWDQLKEPNAIATNEWSRKVLKFLAKKITADELIRLAGTDPDKLTEAHTYIGEVDLISSKQKEAVEHFKWVRSNGNKEFIEYYLAIAELLRIESSETRTTRQ